MPLDTTPHRDSPARCKICGRLLDQPDDPDSLDCGGDCKGCIDAIERDMIADGDCAGDDASEG